MARLDFGTSMLNEDDDDKKLLSFKFNPLGIARTYGVLFVSEDENRKKLQFHYEIDVICIEETQDDHFLFEIFKHQIYINEKTPDILIDELSERCGKVLYPLQLKVNRQGEIIKINNYQYIVDRWEAEKKAILRSYKGKEVTLLMKNMDAVIEDINKLTDMLLQRDWFITLFFAPIYNFNVTKNIALPFIPYQLGCPYEFKNKITKHTHKKEDVVIRLKGKCIDTRSERDILRGNLISLDKEKKRVKGKIDINYQFYKEAKLANAITGICSLDFPSGKSKKMTVEMYNLKNKTPLSSVQKEAISEEKKIAEEKKLPKKKKKKRFSFFKK